MKVFTARTPCNATELVHFRHRIGEEDMELILAESIRVNNEDDDPDHFDTAFIDSTVQEKNITFPTDAKLHKKIVRKVLKIVRKENLPIRQSYARTFKGIYRDQRFRNHPKNRQKARKADRRLRTIAGRLVRELKRNLPTENKYAETIALFERGLSQRRKSTDKIYSLHEPHVKCIGKGKEHKKYEFGNKVSVIRSKMGIILGALSFGNPYDGHTIAPSLEQVFRLTGRHIKLLAADRGYRGTKQVGETRVVIPDTPKKNDSRYQKKKKHRLFCKRGGIVPTIGHLKSDTAYRATFTKDGREML